MTTTVLQHQSWIKGRKYSSVEELAYLFDYCNIRPLQNPLDYQTLIHSRKLQPFVWDGPTDYYSRFLIACLYPLKYKKCVKAIEEASKMHDLEHWLGDESGTTRMLSNKRMRDYIADKGFPLAAEIIHSFIDKYSGAETKPYGWGFGWRNLKENKL